MIPIKARLTVFFTRLLSGERRYHAEPVSIDRRDRQRRKPGLKESEQRAKKALQDLEQTVRMRQEDLNRQDFVAQNDRQTVVVFSTLQEICRFRGPDALRVRICRNPEHTDAANTQFAICDEEHCPILAGALKGAAA